VPLRYRIDPHRALLRVGIALAFALVVGGGVWLVDRSIPIAVLAGWDAGGLLLLSLSWASIGPADAAETHRRSASEDPGRTLVYVVVLITASASLLAATVLSRYVKTITPSEERLAVVLCIATVALAWLLLNTTFTQRYAHLYYRDDAEGIGGVEFPGGAAPTFFDFAYFAFTVGICFQVSDVAVTSSQIRRAVLLHAVIGFVFNTTLLAFVLNLLFGMAV
jgi:uncharacterized membrane protein